MCCFWRQKSKGRATETLTLRVAAYSETKAVWVRACLCEWFVTVCVTVSVNDGMNGLFFFFNNKVSFLLLFSVS